MDVTRWIEQMSLAFERVADEEKMTKSELLESIVRTIGVLDYGKERWFPENLGWYDRYDGRVIDNTEMDRRVQAVLNEWGEEIG